MGKKAKYVTKLLTRRMVGKRKPQEITEHTEKLEVSDLKVIKGDVNKNFEKPNTEISMPLATSPI